MDSGCLKRILVRLVSVSQKQNFTNTINELGYDILYRIFQILAFKMRIPESTLFVKYQ